MVVADRTIFITYTLNITQCSFLVIYFDILEAGIPTFPFDTICYKRFSFTTCFTQLFTDVSIESAHPSC